MQNSQNEAGVVEASVGETPSSGFFGKAQLPDAGAPDVAPAKPEDSAEIFSRVRKPNSLSLAPSAEAAAPKVAAPVPVPPKPVAAPGVPALSVPPPPPKGPVAAQAPRPAAPPPLPAAMPPPVPRGAVVAVAEEKPRGRHKWKVILGIAAPLLAVGVRLSMVYVGPMLDQRFGGNDQLVDTSAWPYLEVNGIQGGADVEQKAILSGEVVPIGSTTANGVAVVEIEAGRVLLGYGGQERWILVGDRTL